jgi:structural maintenance of chromosome 3 (chondroitin sulfate proteoglycan 6)
MPLNRLRSNAAPSIQTTDAVSMMLKIKYDATLKLAFEQVFGRTIICESLAIASQYRRSHEVNGVTIGGDKVDRKGSLTGGYHDVRRSRLDSAKALKRWQESFEDDSARHTEVKEGINKLEQEISTSMGKIQVLEAKRKQILEGRAMMQSQVQWSQREEEQSRQRVARLENALEDAEAELRDAIGKRTAYEEELKTPMRQHLSAEELQSLEDLSKEVETQKKALLEASQARTKVSMCWG